MKKVICILLIAALVLVAVLFPADSSESTSEAVAKVEVLTKTKDSSYGTHYVIEGTEELAASQRLYVG